MIAAIVPAGGRSRRMGRPKLILKIEGQTVIGRTVQALLKGGASPVIVVAPPRSVPGTHELIESATNSGALVTVLDIETHDMRATVEHGLEILIKTNPECCGFLMSPGDCPDLNSGVIANMIQVAAAGHDRIIVPTYNGKRGHPVLFPQSAYPRIQALNPDEGLNSIVNGSPDLIELPVDDSGVLFDLDTPEEYEARAGRSNLK